MEISAKIGLIITAYCDSIPKNDILYNLCLQLRPLKDVFIVVSSHTPIEQRVMKLVDYAIYDKNNVVDRRKYSHGVAESMLIEQGMLALKYYGIKSTFKLAYDCYLQDLSILKEWAWHSAMMVTCYWNINNVPGNISTLAFYTDVEWFLATFSFYKDIDEMFKTSIFIEEVWYKDVLRQHKEGQIFFYPDVETMFKEDGLKNKANIFSKEY